MINFKVLFLVRPVDMELCNDIGAKSTDTLCLHPFVKFLITEYRGAD